MIIRLSLILIFSAITVFSQVPPIEPGVSQELAKWRAAHYSDVRYKLNLTLEKMSPVLKGTIEIRVNVLTLPRGVNFGRGLRSDPETASPGTQAPSPAMSSNSQVSEPGAVATELQSSPPYEGGVDAALGGRGGSLIVLDWRKIRESENLSTISSVSINGRSVENHPVGEAPPPRSSRKEGSFVYTESNEHLIFRDGVVVGENVIKLDFTSPILTSGSAITRYVDKEDGAEYIYSLFVPSDASTAFPVFDQPDLKARFKLTISTPDDWTAVTNSSAIRWVNQTISGPPGNARVISDDYINTFEARETKLISTYVFAFAAGPFQEFTDAGTVGGNPSSSEGAQPGTSSDSSTLPTGRVSASTADLSSHIYVRKSQSKKFQSHAAEVFRLNREGVKYLETYFDYKFPFPKYDIVLIPEFPFGGMEHAGATFLRESSVIFPQEPTKGDYISRAVLIFHETAHQWFGDTVTMKWFDDLWLKEGFAEFMAYKTLEHVMPEANAWKVFYERNKQAAYLTDSTKGTTPIYQEIANLSAAKSAYGNIVYRKAPSFLRQAEFYLGPDKFQTAVRAFLKKHEYANAGWEDLVGEFIDQKPKEPYGADKLVQQFSRIWVTKPGLKRIHTSFHGKGTPKVFPYTLNHYSTSASDDLETLSMDFKCLVVYEDGTRSIEDVDLIWEISSIIPIHRLIKKPVLVFPNYQDYGYGIFLLDDKSRDYVLKNIQNEKDPFLRSMMWGSLWDSVREGELDPKEYIELVVRNLSSDVQSSSFSLSSAPAKKQAKARTLNGEQAEACTLNCPETDESTIQTLLSRVSTAMNYYLPAPSYALANARASASGADRADLQVRLEAVLIERMQNARTLGQRITFYRAFLNIAATENARGVLKGFLTAETQRRGESKSEPGASGVQVATGTKQQSAIPLRTKDKFDIVTRLLILNDPAAPKMLDELIKSETSDDAKRYAYAARAGIASAENKAKFWTDYTTNKDISESWIEASLGAFNSTKHAGLTLPYLERALKELPNLKRNRKIFFVNAWLSAFIGGQRSEEALAIVNKFLADNPGLDKDLRLKILENVDLIERAVKIRSKWGGR